MNLETKITIYKFTPQLFTLTPCKVSYLRGNRCHRHSFPAFPPCTPCVFVITPLRDSHAITVIACRGFSCPVLTDYNPFIFFQV